jgi:thioredoxin reductase (NADPH)
MTEDVIIIGGGPAGLSAAIYLARADLKPLLFAGSPPGGQLTLTSEVENFPGFESIQGSELIEKMRKQAIKFGTRIVDENVIRVDFSNKTHKTYLTNKTHESKSIIIATGAKAIWLGLESETRLRGKGISACATCDGFFFREKIVAVIGGGDTALEEALTLTKFAKKVYIIHRREEFRASKIMIERVKNNKKIEVIWNSKVEEILGKLHVEGIKIQRSQKTDDRKSDRSESQKVRKSDDLTIQLSNQSDSSETSDLSEIKLDGVFVAIGHKPDTDLFKGKIQLDERGYVKLTERRLTSVPGVFAAGDCADPFYRQAITSAGTGVEAALDAERYLETSIK